MCVSTIKIYTNRHCLDYDALHPIMVDVPCGRCYQCRQKNGLEWSTRAYYEAKSTFDNGGFVLFDTLTYSDDHLKRFEDLIPEAKMTAFAEYPTFNKDDLSPFFRRLRKDLENRGYPVKDKLRYLYSSEYGDGEQYVDRNGRLRKGSVRPHYHILFFVTFKINPVLLSRIVAANWRCGITDGVSPMCPSCNVKKYCHRQCLYKSPDYVLQNRVFQRFTLESLNKILYVQKYISKESPYNRLYESRLYNLMNVVYGENWNQSPSKRAIFNRWKRKFTCFHEQSQGFGFGCKVKKLDKEKFLENEPTFESDGELTLQMLKGDVVQKRTLPKFFRQVLLMDKVKCFGGSRYQYLDSSRWYVCAQYRKLFQRLQEQFGAFLSDTSQWYQNRVNEILAGRSIDDFINYKLVYSNRLGNISDSPCDDYLKPRFASDGFDHPHHRSLFVYKNSYSFQYLGFPKNEKFYRHNSHCRKNVRLLLRERKNCLSSKIRDDFAVGL